ncbi:hypothetical protein FE257_007695 [Aspergillus nanangensis]|uniref:Uncharacterized protein n=1 Tax=Aspergillus nanangensis TaxID=2582783 RepID=A0AAD4H002_ASPNN|nr:hypothetical protein FE257_007695 [Aspergillus nanangensis]
MTSANKDKESLQMIDMNGQFPEVFPTAGNIKSLGWEELQEKYIIAMERHCKDEEQVKIQTSDLLEVFVAWSHTSVARDETRALKRFKTQMQHVQISEESLEKKRKHYADVVKAFESALALLNNSRSGH